MRGSHATLARRGRCGEGDMGHRLRPKPLPHVGSAGIL